MKINSNQICVGIIFAGIFFSLYLVGTIPEGTYFSGDAGLKALLAQQLSTGNLRFDLVLSQKDWIHNLWSQGLYPYSEPFVYHLNDRYYITFPFTFPLVTAPFYALMGYRGLYLIPLGAIWTIWITSYWAGQLLKFNSILQIIALISLIFASPLTLYGAMYWEHTLAVSLAFLGLTILLNCQILNEWTNRLTLLSGILIGLSVWFRPEFICLVIIVLFWIYLPLINLGRFKLDSLSNNCTKRNLFSLSIIVTVALFFLFNKVIYDHYVGIHGIQVVEETSLKEKIKEFSVNFKGLSVTFLDYFPITWFGLFYFISCFLKKEILKKNIIMIYGYCLLFIVGVSLLVPGGTAGLIPGGKQWGTRFLLLLIPVILLLTIKQGLLINNSRFKPLKYTSFFLLSLLLIFSSYKNLYLGTNYLNTNYQQNANTLEVVNKSSLEIVAISHQFVGQVLQAGINNKKEFLRVETIKELEILGNALLSHNYQSFLYICYPFRPCQLPEEASNKLKLIKDGQTLTIKFTPLNNKGQYPVYEVSILPIK